MGIGYHIYTNCPPYTFYQVNESFYNGIYTGLIVWAIGPVVAPIGFIFYPAGWVANVASRNKWTNERLLEVVQDQL